MPNRHLTKLPPKSDKVAPGDIIGGLIYVMDKPLGIEDGMVGISIDSEPYRAFIQEQIQLLQNSRHPNQDIQVRFDLFKDEHPEFEGLPLAEENGQIDLVLRDQKHKKKGKGYVNQGLGGLLFNAYLESLNIEPDDNVFSKLAKLSQSHGIDGKVETDEHGNPKPLNDVYMVKQDSKKVFGRTGPSMERVRQTANRELGWIKKRKWLNVLTLGIPNLIFGAAVLGWRANVMRENNPTSAGSDAVVETAATKIGEIRGVSSQSIDVIEGEFKGDPNTPKIMTLVKWSTGFRDLAGGVAGGGKTSFNDNYIVKKENGFPVKLLDDGSMITCKKTETGNLAYILTLPNGDTQPTTEAQYDQAPAMSDDSVMGLGEALVSFISMGDRDKVGKQGQNMGIMPLIPPQGRFTKKYFGIDYGKSYENENERVKTLRDDFSFDNPEGGRETFANFSIMYDNPLRDKMKGVYLLGVLRGKIPQDLKQQIADDYEQAGDKIFADKLRSYPNALKHDYLEKIKQPDGSTIDVDISDNGDLWLMKLEELKYRTLAEQSKSKKKKKIYNAFAERLKEAFNRAYANDEIVLNVFKDRMQLTPKQIDILDNLEKLTAQKVSTLSKDGKVRLNHLQVDQKDRTPWQFKADSNGNYTLICEVTDFEQKMEIKKKIEAIADLDTLDDPVLKGILTRFQTNDKGQFIIEHITPDEINALHHVVTEEKAASIQNTSLARPHYYTTEVEQAPPRREARHSVDLRAESRRESHPHPKARTPLFQFQQGEELNPDEELAKRESVVPMSPVLTARTRSKPAARESVHPNLMQDSDPIQAEDEDLTALSLPMDMSRSNPAEVVELSQRRAVAEELIEQSQPKIKKGEEITFIPVTDNAFELKLFDEFKEKDWLLLRPEKSIIQVSNREKEGHSFQIQEVKDGRDFSCRSPEAVQDMIKAIDDYKETSTKSIEVEFGIEAEDMPSILPYLLELAETGFDIGQINTIDLPDRSLKSTETQDLIEQAQEQYRQRRSLHL